MFGESSDVWALRREPPDFADCGGGNHGNARFVEDAAVEVRHLDRRTMAVTDLPRQFLAEHGQELSFWRANVSRDVSTDGGSPPFWSKENQLRKLGGGQPRETAAIVSPTEGQAPVAIETVPAQVGDLEKFAAHGLHWVSKERLYFTNLDRHVRRHPHTVGINHRSITPHLR
jgi:hypothetical protein